MNGKIGLPVRFFILFLFVPVFFMSSETQAALVSVPAANLLPDALSQDFEGESVGPITGNDAAFSSINVSNASLVGTFVGLGDALDSGYSGNALVSNNNTLSVQAPLGPMDNIGSGGGGYRFTLSVPASQFGFVMVDQVNFTTEIEIFSAGQSLGILVYNVPDGFPQPFVLFESLQPFDTVEIRSGQNGGWGLDDITLAGFGPQQDISIPTMNEWGMIFMAIMMAGSAFWMLKRRQES